MLLTTRDTQLLPRGVPAMQVGALDGPAALHLFDQHANPPAERCAEAAELAKACGGLPLALTVVGELLRDKHSRADWEQVLSRLRAAKPFTGGKRENDSLWGKLKLSFDALYIDEQQMFLDIACIMTGKDASACLPAWGRLAHSMLQHLIKRSLVAVDGEGRLAMQDQLRDLGLAIASEEDPAHVKRIGVGVPGAERVLNGQQVCS